MKQKPCKPNCPKRNSECHATCEEYLIYFYDNRERNMEDLKRKQAEQMLCDMTSRRANRMQRSMKKDIKLDQWST